MKIRKTFSIGIALTALALGLVPMSAAAKDTEVNIGYFNNVTHAQALYMKATGSLKEAFPDDVKINWTAFNAGPAEVEALFAEDIDIGYIGPVPAITANVRSEGDVTILCGAAQAGAILVKSADAEISSVADLDGKTVAIPQLGNTQHLCLLKLLSDNGLAPVEQGGTVTVAAVENADVLNMMDQGNIDAALVPEPWGATLLSGGAEIVLDYDEVYRDGDYPVTVVVVRNEFLEEHPDIVDAFYETQLATTALLSENAEEAASVVNEELNEATGKSLDPSILTDAFGRIIFSDEVSEDAMQDFADISLEQGFILESYENLFTEH